MKKSISPPFVTYVERVGDEGPSGPLDVVFFGNAAIFSIERTHPCFRIWSDMAKTSHDERRTIVFTSTWAARILSLEVTDKFFGIVDTIDEALWIGSRAGAVQRAMKHSRWARMRTKRIT